MKQSSFRAFVAVVLLTAGLQSSAQSTTPSGAETPSSLKVTLKSGALQRRLRGPYEVSLFDTPFTQDVINGNDEVGGQFTTTTTAIGSYTGTQIDMDEQALFSGIDPCSGTTVTDAPVRLADDGASDLFVTYQEPHPVTGLPADALPADPFTLSSDIPIDFHLIFPVTHHLVCLSDTPPLQIINGLQTGLGSPFDLVVDTNDDEYIVSNPAVQRITFYDRATVSAATDPNISPAYLIAGADTQLNSPTGMAIDPVTDDLYVANAGQDTNGYYDITVYNRNDVTASTDGNVAPARTIGGANTGLDIPGGIAIDTVNNELAVVNGHANSVTIYDNPAGLHGDTVPTYIIQGNNTGLGSPCGIDVDSSNDVIYVTNNSLNSITVYSRSDVTASTDGNVTPLYTIQGANTGLSAPCGIDVDTTRGEIAVSSGLNSRILFFSTTNNAGVDNVYPLRRLQGTQTQISGPTGLKVDDANGEIAILNNGGVARANLILRCLGVTSANSQCNGSDAVASPHMTDPPILVNSITQQSLYVNYVFNGSVDRVTGEPTQQTDPYTGVDLPTISAGYNFIWRIYDTSLRQSSDANSARLIPPPQVVWGLGPGTNPPTTLVSNLELGCPAFTPFTILTLSTNCTPPLITYPYPPQSAPDFRLIAALLGQAVIKKLPLSVAPLTVTELPHLDMHLTLSASSSIVKMTWDYVNGNDASIQSPELLIQTQSISINLTRPFTDVDPCYKQVTGNASTLVFSSATMGSDARELDAVKNNSCVILLNDVDTITFTATDPLGNRYVYQVKPSGTLRDDISPTSCLDA